MKVRTTDWHYKFYAFSYEIWDKDVPVPRDGCTYIRRIIFVAPAMFLLACGMIAFLFLFMSLIATPLYILLGFINHLFGRIPQKGFWGEYVGMWKWENESKEGLWCCRRYEAPKVAGISLYPWVFLFGGALIGFSVRYFSELVDFGRMCIQLMGEYPWVTSLAALVFFGCIALRLFIIRKSLKEWFAMIKQYAEAKKQKICPMIEFVDDVDGA